MTMSKTWEVSDGRVLVVEDAKTASLVVVARDLKDRDDKIAALEEVLREIRSCPCTGTTNSHGSSSCSPPSSASG